MNLVTPRVGLSRETKEKNLCRAGASNSSGVPLQVFFDSCIWRLLTDARLQQSPPSEAAFQPLRNHGVALHVRSQVLGSELPPANLMKTAKAERAQCSDLNFSIVNAVFLNL
jgi:hypothetical protein